MRVFSNCREKKNVVNEFRRVDTIHNKKLLNLGIDVQNKWLRTKSSSISQTKFSMKNKRMYYHLA